MFVNKLYSHILRAYILKGKRSFNVISSTFYFHVKAKIMADFQICISVPLKPFADANFSKFHTLHLHVVRGAVVAELSAQFYVFSSQMSPQSSSP